jgi:hypothetical protein
MGLEKWPVGVKDLRVFFGDGKKSADSILL